MFTAALFTIAPKWKQPKCPSVGKWINKICYSYTVGYYWVRKSNKVQIHAKTRSDFEALWSVKRS